MVGQYIKDLSFENPNVGKLLEGPATIRNLKIEVNVNARQAHRTGPLRERHRVQGQGATSKAGVIYELEIGLRRHVQDREHAAAGARAVPAHQCPSLLFPFLRRLVADLTREGGFPPLMLDPIDFGVALHAAQAAEQGQPSGRQSDD